ncbi:MAG: ribonuclease PH [Deltaproteobacteria bacterium]|nr:ribonuclease PH [Deltaproteobacteria bacterium]
MTRARVRERAADELRPIEILPDVLEYPAGSALVHWGKNRVLCAVSVEEQLPAWKKNSDTGWLTAEYGMLPAATHTRSDRERSRGKPDGRSLEISRLVGRSLRAALDLQKLGPRTLHVDCDVLQADGGTRGAAITGASVALELALRRLRSQGRLREQPLRFRLAAVSAGLLDGQPLLDLDYADDHRAQVDVNFVLTAHGELVEVQGTAEGRPFTFGELEALAGLARQALPRLLAVQERALGEGGG